MGKAGKTIMVLLQSLAGTGHKVIRLRPKVGDKLEMISFDPYVQKSVLYREMKKIRTLKSK
ncbi:large ribosomal subunit protein bL33m-like [Babylonia areolata]|uniref:large ribosomal subunit protein bL33m-like n=1 Tax=Babylonia areolata TaxID=304850 RepID=UPI003FD23BF6